jgi:hypothetical protein
LGSPGIHKLLIDAHAEKKQVTIQLLCCRDLHLNAEETTVLIRIAAGEIGCWPAPKEQPPRKLSGRRTAQSHHKTLERDARLRPPTG